MQQQITEQLEIDFDHVAACAAALMKSESAAELDCNYEAYQLAICAAVPPCIGERRPLFRLGVAMYNQRAQQIGIRTRHLIWG